MTKHGDPVRDGWRADDPDRRCFTCGRLPVGTFHDGSPRYDHGHGPDGTTWERQPSEGSDPRSGVPTSDRPLPGIARFAIVVLNRGDTPPEADSPFMRRWRRSPSRTGTDRGRSGHRLGAVRSCPGCRHEHAAGTTCMQCPACGYGADLTDAARAIFGEETVLLGTTVDDRDESAAMAGVPSTDQPYPEKEDPMNDQNVHHPLAITSPMDEAAATAAPEATVILAVATARSAAAARAIGLQPVEIDVRGTAMLDPTTLRSLAGRRVVLWPKSDEEGFEWTCRIVPRLDGIAASIRIARWQDGPEHGDLEDLLARPGGPDEARRLIADAPEVRYFTAGEADHHHWNRMCPWLLAALPEGAEPGSSSRVPSGPSLCHFCTTLWPRSEAAVLEPTDCAACGCDRNMHEPRMRVPAMFCGPCGMAWADADEWGVSLMHCPCAGYRPYSANTGPVGSRTPLPPRRFQA